MVGDASGAGEGGGHQMIEFISQCYGPEQAVQAARFASHSKLKVAFNN